MAGKLDDIVHGGADEQTAEGLGCEIGGRPVGSPCAPRPTQAEGGPLGLLGLLRQAIRRALTLVERAVHAGVDGAGGGGHQAGFTPAAPAAHGGWSFREGAFTFRGQTCRLKGVSLRLLRCLVEAGPEGASLREIRGRVWPDARPQLLGGTQRDLVLRRAPSAVTALRWKLRALLRLPDDLDPVPYADGAYRLNVPGAAPG